MINGQPATIEEVSELITGLGEMISMDFKKVNDRFDRADQRSDSIKTHLGNLESEIHQIRTEVAFINRGLDGLEHKVDQDKFEAIKQRVIVLEHQLKQLQKKNA